MSNKRQQRLTPAAWTAIGVIMAALFACFSGVIIASIQIFPDVLPAIFPPTALPPTSALPTTNLPTAIQPTTVPPTIFVPVSPSNTPSQSASPDTIGFVVTILDAANGKLYSYFTGTLEVGATVYSDRDYVYSTIPSFLQGNTYVATPNADLFSTDTNLLTFSINRDAIVYIAHDDRYINKPPWLNSFQDTGTDLEYLWTGGVIKLSLYGKQFSKGQVALGGNISSGETGNHGMYTIVIVEK